MAGKPVGPQQNPAYTTARLLVAPGARSALAPRSVVVAPARRFFVHPRASAYFTYYSPWPYSFLLPPDYGAYVYGWSAAYYPQAPSQDVKRYGLPEGVIKPGGSVSGFLYFQNAGARATRLRLVWRALTPQGQPVTTLRTDFVVVSH
jgi:hypothetical protein